MRLFITDNIHSLHLHQLLVPPLHPLRLACFIHFYLVAFSLEFGRLGRYLARVLLVELAFALECPPVGRDVFLSLRQIFPGRTGRDAGKNAGGDGSAESGVVPSRHYLAYLVDGDELTGRDAFHEGVDLQRGRDDTGALAPLFAHLLIDLDDSWQMVFDGGRRELFSPAQTQCCHQISPPLLP